MLVKMTEAKEIKVLEIVTGLAAILAVFIAVPVFILMVDISWELYRAIKRRK